MNLLKTNFGLQQRWHGARLGCMLLLLLVGIIADANHSPAMAQQVKEPELRDPEMKKRPGLAGHRFVENQLTGDAFPRTSVAISMGVGQALDVELLPTTILSNGDTLQGLQGDLGVALLGFQYGYAVRDWLEVSGGIGLVARLGTDVGSLFSEGATILSNFDIGWLFRILERRSVYLSGSAVVSTNSFTGLQIGEWVEGVLDSTNVPLVNTVPSLRSTAGLLVAWAINDLWGLSGSTHLGYGELVSKRLSNSTSYQIALSVDADLYARTSVPIGFSLGAQVSNTAIDGRPDVDDVLVGNLRTAYTGKDDFLLAVDFNFSRLKPRQDVDTRGVPKSTRPLNTGALMATMRYFF